jgi:lipid A 3-O-deacylase
MKLKAFRLIILLILLSSVAAAQIEKGKHRGRLSFRLENDLFAGTDRDYTSGMRLTWISPGKIPENRPGYKNVMSVSFGQSIYTPGDITRSDLIKEDRPYAGITYVGIGLHTKHKNWMSSFQLDVGIVGPHSYAEQCQKKIHGIFGGKDPQGWKHQLKDEFAFAFLHDRVWKIPESKIAGNLGFDFVVHTGGSLGNIMTAASTGTEFRVGWNIPDDFGTFLVRPGGESPTFFDEQSPASEQKRLSYYLFALVEGHAVLRNIFLDGNTFRESHRVDKNLFVADIVIGIALCVGRFKVNYGYVYRTKQFETQKRNQIFGAIKISFSYGL